MNDFNLFNKTSTGKDPLEGILYRDPVCGMATTDPEAYLRYMYKAKTYHFCNNHCLEAFKKNPELYIEKDEGHDSTNFSSSGLTMISPGQTGNCCPSSTTAHEGMKTNPPIINLSGQEYRDLVCGMTTQDLIRT
jgi:YHS domain-containing protein